MGAPNIYIERGREREQRERRVTCRDREIERAEKAAQQMERIGCSRARKSTTAGILETLSQFKDAI